MLFKERIVIYCENRMKSTNILYEKNAVFYYVNAGSTGFKVLKF
jgi:hypothetical protein